MAKQWNDQTYNEDWVPIDAMGNATGEKDWAASNANTPAPVSNQAPAATTSQAPYAPGVGANGAAAPGKWQPLESNTLNTINKDTTWNGVVDTNDPAFKQQMDANALQTNLAGDRARASMAQRRAATGTGSSGAVDTDVNKIQEQQSFQDKQFEAGLFDKFRQQGLQQKAQALGLGSGMLTAQEERALRDRLTMEGYDVQRDLAANELDFKRDELGQNLAVSQADLDARMMLGLLGGA